MLMAFNMSAWSIRHPLPPIVMAAAIVVLGCISFSKLPVTRMPNIDVPVISVTVAQVGAAPAELESRVTKIVEDAVAGVTGTHHINSVITDGISNTTILFHLETNTDRALNDVKDAVTSIRANLPRGIEEPLIQRVDIAGLPILTYAAIAPGKTPEQLSWFVDDVVIRALQGVRGVARVDRIGSVEREIRVGLDPVRLQSVGLTPLDVSRQLRGSNVDLAGGRAEIGGRDQAIRTLAGAKTVADLAATRIALPAGGEVRLDDLGLITDTIAEPRTFARFDGAPVVGFNILRAKGASDVVLADAIAARIDAIKAANPTVDLKLIDTSVVHTLGTGILVDDAIVEIENIVRHIRMGKSPYQAALEAADEIGLAVIAISLAIVAVFIPASFMPSVPGQFFKQFGITVSVQVLFSLLCARMITPMLAAFFLRPHQHQEKGDGRVMRLYTRLVTGAVRYRFITVAIGFLLFFASLAGARFLSTGFLPVTDTARSMLGIELPPGSQLSDTEAVTDAIAKSMRSQ